MRSLPIITYIDNNAMAVVNYGERISTGFAESAINQGVAKRFVEKQQRRWTPRGAHLLLQVRVRVLNHELHTAFQRWYPNFGSQATEALAACTPEKWMLSYLSGHKHQRCQPYPVKERSA